MCWIQISPKKWQICLVITNHHTLNSHCFNLLHRVPRLALDPGAQAETRRGCAVALSQMPLGTISVWVVLISTMMLEVPIMNHDACQNLESQNGLSLGSSWASKVLNQITDRQSCQVPKTVGFNGFCAQLLKNSCECHQFTKLTLPSSLGQTEEPKQNTHRLKPSTSPWNFKGLQAKNPHLFHHLRPVAFLERQLLWCRIVYPNHCPCTTNNSLRCWLHSETDIHHSWHEHVRSHMFETEHPSTGRKNQPNKNKMVCGGGVDTF